VARGGTAGSGAARADRAAASGTDATFTGSGGSISGAKTGFAESVTANPAKPGSCAASGGFTATYGPREDVTITGQPRVFVG
jgi:hypothetical protein